MGRLGPALLAPCCLRPPTCPFCKPHPMYAQVYHTPPLIPMTALGRPSPASWKPPFMPWAFPVSQPWGGSKTPRVIFSGDSGGTLSCSLPRLPWAHPASCQPVCRVLPVLFSAGEKARLYVTHLPWTPCAPGPWVPARRVCTCPVSTSTQSSRSLPDSSGGFSQARRSDFAHKRSPFLQERPW